MNTTLILSKQYCQEELPDLERDVSEAIETFEYEGGDGLCNDLEGYFAVTVIYFGNVKT